MLKFVPNHLLTNDFLLKSIDKCLKMKIEKYNFVTSTWAYREHQSRIYSLRVLVRWPFKQDTITIKI